MIDICRLEPLFDERSTKLESRYFRVFPGEVAVIQAFGFAEYKTPVPGEFKAHQAVCLEQVLFKVEPLPEKPCGTCGGGIIDITKHKGEVLAYETVRSNGCGVSMDLCNNILLWNIPGSYRFVLNDQSAIGQVRIYLRIITKDEFPWNIAPIHVGGQNG